jgi:hypothetical protein
MSTTQSSLDLIDQCQFSDEDPFEINQNLFPNLKSLLPASIIKRIESECYATWLNWAFEGESIVSVVYQIIQIQISNNLVNYFSHLDTKEKQQIDDYFSNIINEAREHRIIFKNMIEKLQQLHLPADIKYRPEFFDPDLPAFNSYWNDQYNKVGFLSVLGVLAIGESYLLACFFLFYKQSSNKLKKQIFKQFLTEESQHIAHFLNLIKKGKYSDEDKERLHHIFLQVVQQKTNFEIKTVNSIYTKLQKAFNIKISNKENNFLISNDSEKFNQIAYSGKLHESFKELFLRRSYQFYHAVFPDVNENEFLYLVENYQTSNDFVISDLHLVKNY